MAEQTYAFGYDKVNYDRIVHTDASNYTPMAEKVSSRNRFTRAMKTDIYIAERNGNREIRIPWLPEKINYESGGTIRASYDIMNRGPVEVPTGSGLCSYSWESEFPGNRRVDDAMMHGTWKEPAHYHNILEDWKAKGTRLVLIVTGYPINKDVYLDDYKGEPSGGFGDWSYEVIFIEFRDITIESSVIKEETPKRTAENSSSYTVVKGDCLWKIAEKKYKNGASWRKIYDANKEVIESTAKKYGYKSSNNGHWIFPGTVLTIPQ